MSARSAHKEWEYRIVRFFGESSGKQYATHVNGSRIGTPGSIGVRTPELSEFLNQLGLEGWEMVGLCGSPAEGLIMVKREVLYG